MSNSCFFPLHGELCLPEIDGKAYQVPSSCDGNVFFFHAHFLHQIHKSSLAASNPFKSQHFFQGFQVCHGKVLISGLVKTGSLREAVALVDEAKSFLFFGIENHPLFVVSCFANFPCCRNVFFFFVRRCWTLLIRSVTRVAAGVAAEPFCIS